MKSLAQDDNAVVFESRSFSDQSGMLENTRPQWIALVIGLLITLLILLFVTDGLFNPQKFQIKNIEVHGQFDHVDGNDIKRIVESALEGNYFSVSLHRLENEITKIPWVFSASLRRKWPSSIVVDVVEVQPVANWGGNKWLNFTGDLVDRQEIQLGNSDLGDDKTLPILHGPESERKAVWKAFQNWSGRLALNGLVLNELRLDSRDLWYLNLSLSALVLNNDQSSQGVNRPFDPVTVTMVVDRDNAYSRIRRFLDALNQDLIIQFPEMASIDLRYPNGFAIRWYEAESVAQTLIETGVD